VFTDGTDFAWKLTTLVAQSGHVEPAFTAHAGDASFVDGVGNTWTKLGATAVVVPCDYVDGQVISRESHTRFLRQDTAATDPGTAAPKSPAASFVFEATTTTNTANQVLCTLDSLLFGGSGALPDNCVYHVELLIKAKTPAGATEAGSNRLSGDFYRNGGTLTQIGETVAISNYIAGTINDFGSLTSNTIPVLASPAVNTTIGWTIEGTISKRLD
jgi:hypothetical protein